jgi:hypothetical protein
VAEVAKPVKNKNSSTLEMAAVVCFVVGFAMYVAVDTGIVKIAAFGKSSATSASSDLSNSLERPEARIARVKALNDKIELVEDKMKEKEALLGKMSEELQELAGRLNTQKKSLGSMSTMVFEIEKDRAELKHESGMLSTEGKLSLNGALADIARAANKSGIDNKHLSSIKWKNHSYLRLVNAFEFQTKGVYMRMGGIDKADAIADAVEAGDLRELTVVYRDPDKGGQDFNRERAFVLRNHFKETLGEEFNVKISRVDSELVAQDAIELWVGEK